MTRSPSLLLAALLTLPASLHAQHATRDSTLATRVSADADSIARDKTAPAYTKRAVTRLKARADSLRQNAATAFRTDTLRLVDTVFAARPDSTVTQAGAPVDSTPAPPPAIAFAHPFAPPSNGAVLAELPRDTMPVGYPTILRRYRCTNLQACLDTAKTGDELLLAPGSVHPNVIVKPTARTGWVAVRTDLVDLGGPWERMTPERATALALATITSSTTDTPFTVSSGAHHVYLDGVRVTTTAPESNALIRLGLWESAVDQIPHDIVLRHVVADGGSNQVRRCVALDSYRTAIVSGSLVNCHSNVGDSQGINSINGRGTFRVEHTLIQGGHQCLMFGGGDPKVVGQVPSDVVFRRNVCDRPVAWRGVWGTKTIIELKIGKRVLFEGNVVCHVWPDGQAAFAFLFKSVNQDNTAPWSETSDITVRYNRLCASAGGFNLAPRPEWAPAVPASRITIYGNAADSIAVCPYCANVDAVLQQGVSDVVLKDNWFRNPGGRAAIYFIGPSQRFVATGNTFGGQYGWKGDGAVWSDLVPGSVTTGNTLVGWGVAFGAWPALTPNATRDSLLTGVAP